MARHGQSENNVSRVVNADPERSSPLTRRGRSQARALGRRLVGEPVEVCATSQLARAKETAAIALAGRGIPFVELEQFNEPRAGRFEGTPVDDYDRWFTDRGLGASENGIESQLAALRRYVDGFEALLTRAEPTVLLVAHTLPLAWLFAAVRGETRVPDVIHADVPNAVLHRFAAEEVRRALRRLTDWAESQR